MTNKNMVLCIYLVMGFFLYDLYFDIAWPFSPHNHYIVEVVMAILCVYIVFEVISLTFPGLSKLSKFQTSRPKGSRAATLPHYNDNAYNIFIRL